MSAGAGETRSPSLSLVVARRRRRRRLGFLLRSRSRNHVLCIRCLPGMICRHRRCWLSPSSSSVCHTEPGIAQRWPSLVGEPSDIAKISNPARQSDSQMVSDPFSLQIPKSVVRRGVVSSIGSRCAHHTNKWSTMRDVRYVMRIRPCTLFPRALTCMYGPAPDPFNAH